MILVVLGFLIGFFVFVSWLFMVLFNIVAVHFHWPTISLGISMAIIALLAIIKGQFTVSSKS